MQYASYLVLVMPAINAESEHSFSFLRCLKSVSKLNEQCNGASIIRTNYNNLNFIVLWWWVWLRESPLFKNASYSSAINLADLELCWFYLY